MRLGRYEVLGKLGSGGMAEVLLARLEGTGGFERRVVIKRVLAERAHDAEFRRLFEQEARFASLISHPNVAQVFDFGVDETGASYLVMELVDGISLREAITAARSRNEVIEVKVLCRIFAQLAEALAAVHEAVDPASGFPLQLVHRDVSPDNVLLSRHGAVKLSDFGIARATTELSLTRPDLIRGKLHYLGPEQLLGTPIGPSLDVWAFGASLSEALTLKRAFDGENEGRVMHAIVNEPPPSLRADLPPALIGLVDRCLHKRPEDRPANLREIAATLDALASGMTSSAVGQWVSSIAPPTDPPVQPFSFGTTSTTQSPRREVLSKRFAEAPAVVEALVVAPVDRPAAIETTEVVAQKRPFNRRRALLAAGILVALSVGALIIATRVPPTIAQVLIISEPSGATIHIGGRTVGTTPWGGTLDLARPIPVELELNGYQVASPILEMGNTSINITLARNKR